MTFNKIRKSYAKIVSVSARPARLTRALTLAAIVMAAPMASAGDYFWSGADGGDWADGNWTLDGGGSGLGSGLFTSADDISINTAAFPAAVTQTYLTTSVSARTVNVNASLDLSGSLDLSADGSSFSEVQLIGGTITGTGSLAFADIEFFSGTIEAGNAMSATIAFVNGTLTTIHRDASFTNLLLYGGTLQSSAAVTVGYLNGEFAGDIDGTSDLTITDANFSGTGFNNNIKSSSLTINGVVSMTGVDDGVNQRRANFEADSILNSGTIETTSSNSMFAGAEIELRYGAGGFVNDGTMTASGNNTKVQTYGDSDFTNNGLMSVSGSQAYNWLYTLGNIVNDGVVDATAVFGGGVALDGNGNITNNNAVMAGGGYVLMRANGTFSNTGVVTSDAGWVELGGNAGSSNTGTIDLLNYGFVSMVGLWTPGDFGTIGDDGTGRVEFKGYLDITGTSLDILSLPTNNFSFHGTNNNGRIFGGDIINASSMRFSGEYESPFTLEDVTLDGQLNLWDANGTAQIAGSTQVNGAYINNSTLWFRDTHTTDSYFDFYYGNIALQDGVELTLSPLASVTGYGVTIGEPGSGREGTTLVVQNTLRPSYYDSWTLNPDTVRVDSGGQLAPEYYGSSLYVNTTDFTNDGNLLAGDGFSDARLEVNASTITNNAYGAVNGYYARMILDAGTSFSNTGYLMVNGNGYDDPYSDYGLHVGGGSSSNTGTIDVQNYGNLYLINQWNSADILGITGDGTGNVRAAGVLEIGGGILDPLSITPNNSFFLDGATVRNGHIINSADLKFSGRRGEWTSFENVTFDGDLYLTNRGATIVKDAFTIFPTTIHANNSTDPNGYGGGVVYRNGALVQDTIEFNYGNILADYFATITIDPAASLSGDHVWIGSGQLGTTYGNTVIVNKDLTSGLTVSGDEWSVEASRVENNAILTASNSSLFRVRSENNGLNTGQFISDGEGSRFEIGGSWLRSGLFPNANSIQSTGSGEIALKSGSIDLEGTSFAAGSFGTALRLDNGTLKNGTINDAFNLSPESGSFYNGLENVTVNGTLQTGSGGFVIRNSTLNDGVDLSGYGGVLFEDGVTLDSSLPVTSSDGGYLAVGYGQLMYVTPTGSLTAPNLTLGYSYPYYRTGDLLNEGTLSSNSGGYWSLRFDTIDNLGTLEAAGAGSDLDVYAYQTFTNQASGVIKARSGAYLALSGGNLTNLGLIESENANSVVAIGGNWTTAGLGNLSSVDGGILRLNDTNIDNGGDTFDAHVGLGDLFEVYSARFDGGQIASSDTLNIQPYSFTEFVDTTLSSGLDLTNGGYAALRGTTTSTIDSYHLNNGAQLWLDNGSTFGGEVHAGSVNSQLFFTSDFEFTPSALIQGGDLTIRPIYGNGVLTNSGLISSDGEGSRVYLTGVSRFTNAATGFFEVKNGATAFLEGNSGGTWKNEGTLQSVGAGPTRVSEMFISGNWTDPADLGLWVSDGVGKFAFGGKIDNTSDTFDKPALLGDRFAFDGRSNSNLTGGAYVLGGSFADSDKLIFQNGWTTFEDVQLDKGVDLTLGNGGRLRLTGLSALGTVGNRHVKLGGGSILTADQDLSIEKLTSVANAYADLGIEANRTVTLTGETNVRYGEFGRSFWNGSGNRTLVNQGDMTVRGDGANYVYTENFKNQANLIVNGYLYSSNGLKQEAGETNVNGTLASNVDITGGTLSGDGIVYGSVNNGGTISPGNSVGSLEINGNYVQTGQYFFDIQASAANPDESLSADTLTVYGDVFLNGELYANLDMPIDILRRHELVLLTYTGTRTGEFNLLASNFNPWAVNGGGNWTIWYDDANKRVVAMVPEPGTMTVLAIGALALLRRRRAAKA